MISTVYVERAVRDHPRARRILDGLPDAVVVECEHYSEIFNRRQQSFRLQKRNPSLILACKGGELVHPTPEGYGVGGARNYYFSHMLNCPYDCRYCFLQGMFRSAHQVLFVNYEDFFERIIRTAEGEAGVAERSGEAWFFSGYDCDSLAFERVSRFVAEAMDYWSRCDRPPWLELRTKSASIKPLLERDPHPRIVVAYSLSPAEVADAVEHRAPPVSRRIQALKRLQQHGYSVGLRFDPLLYSPDAVSQYRELFEQIFAAIDGDLVHSVSLGQFRLPKDFHRRLLKLYPTEPLLAAPFTEQTLDQAGGSSENRLVSYREDIGRELFEGCRELLSDYVREDQYYPMLS